MRVSIIKQIVYIIGCSLFYGVTLYGCNTGSVSSQTQGNTSCASLATNLDSESSTLNDYIMTLSCTSNTIEPFSNSSQKQVSFKFKEPTVISNITTYFYNDTACNNEGSRVSFDGNELLSKGIYTTSDVANYNTCAQYTHSESGNVCSIEGDYTRSMRYTLTLTSPETGVFDSGCLHNPSSYTLGEQLASWFGAIIASCSNSPYSCGFSQSYVLQVSAN